MISNTSIYKTDTVKFVSLTSLNILDHFKSREKIYIQPILGKNHLLQLTFQGPRP